MPRNIARPARRSSRSSVGSQMNSADSDSNERRRQYGSAIGAEVVQRLPCGWRRGCRSLRAKLCFDRGNVFQYWRTKLEEACVSCFAPQIPAWNHSETVRRSPWYSRRSTVPGLRRGKQELAAGTLTPSILVRIQVPQPGSPVSGVLFPRWGESPTFPWVTRADPSLWSVIFRISVRARRVLGAGLWLPFFNFPFGGAETGSIADRDRFAGDPWRVRRTPARSSTASVDSLADI